MTIDLRMPPWEQVHFIALAPKGSHSNKRQFHIEPSLRDSDRPEKERRYGCL